MTIRTRTRTRAIVVAVTALAALLLGVVPASAGGWAVTTLDTGAVPEESFIAGKTYRVGYTIRQHGQSPYKGADEVPALFQRTAIRVWSASPSETTPTTGYVFFGKSDGVPGHYVAEVRLPGDGIWRWEVNQGPFEPQSLGELSVRPTVPMVLTLEPAPAQAAPASQPQPVTTPREIVATSEESVLAPTNSLVTTVLPVLGLLGLAAGLGMLAFAWHSTRRGVPVS